MSVDILRAHEADAEEILQLQKLAYTREAELYGDNAIEPLESIGYHMVRTAAINEQLSTTNAPSEAELSTEVAVRLNDPIHQSICPLCHQPIKDLKHTIICGCGSKIKNTIKFK